ncbi:pyridoxal phosphate-dependent aminotransferase [Streptomyces sp. 3214.6]|uniref:pyridoxal phosphate-dependent aminotransferase n=1 Tax=Streptomyces sp. 3214.6 TaxID=1882757 RepID=UPI0009095D01|nr:pyridoxal phosphate-dependent aminotransferase [Streptomyces sp. 3214.6]SHI48650.1 N-succinyldiaminopimelate aminotransferase [Streptomyces sp. 3214.6]
MSIRKAPLSHRVAALAPMSLAGLAATAREIGAVDIASGVPVHDPPDTVLTAAATAMRTGRNQYAPAAGTPALRRAVARHLRRTRGVDVDPDHEITITSGATEGALVALLAAVDPGDEVILPEPYFESYPGTVRLLGAVPRPVRLSGAGWRLDPDAIRAAITPRTRAILLNTPHNPTGRVFTADEMLALVEICVRHGIVCITDEVYDNFVFDPAGMTSPLNLAQARDHSIVVGSFSKSLQMSGWRLGYCVAGAELTAGLRRVVERTTVCASTPLQEGTAAATGFSSGAEDFRDRRDHMVKRLGQAGLDVFAPEGGWFVFAGIRGVTDRSSRELAERLLDRAGVLVAPGTPFFSDPQEGGGWIRTTFVRDPDATDEGLDRLERFLRGAP